VPKVLSSGHSRRMRRSPPVPDPLFTGGCGCGAVRWELNERPIAIGYCHCTRCQRRSGTAASLNANVNPEAFQVVEGEELVQSWKPEGGAAKSFCSKCGSALWAGLPGAVYAVRLGTFDEDPQIEPSYRQFVAYAASWEPIPEDGVPRYPERRPS
jgi:hypothetical protein